MFLRPVFSVSVLSAYVLLFNLLFYTDAPLSVMVFMFSLSPFLVIWMVYVILKYDTKKVRDLEPEEEWAYNDKNKNELDVF